MAVTGGASGIGRALAQRFASEGAKGVAVADLDADGARTVAEGIGTDALGVGCDVAAEDQVRALIARDRGGIRPDRPLLRERGHRPGDRPRHAGRRLDPGLRRQRSRARPGGAAPGPGLAREGRGVFPLDRVGGRPPDADRIRPVCGHEACRGGAGGMACGHLRRQGDPGQLPVSDGRRHRHAERGPGRGRPRRPRRAGGGRHGRTYCSPRKSPTPWSRQLREERFLILPHPEVLEFFRRKGSDYDRWIAGMQRLQAHVEGEASAAS